MRFGLISQLFESSWRDVRDAALRAEAAGWDDVVVTDHLLGMPDPQSRVLEGWTTLCALAEATDRLGLGSLVFASTFRPPRLFAKQVQTLAEVAGPRLVLGLGAGWHEEEHHAFGLPFPTPRERLARLEETVDAMRELAPEVPILLGGAGPRLQELAARKADCWNVPGDRLDDFPELVAQFDERRREADRDVTIVASVGLLLSDTSEDAEARLARRTNPMARIGLGPLGLVGDADEIVRRIERLRQLGVSRLVIGLSPRDVQAGILERFAGLVIERVRSSSEGGSSVPARE